MLPHSPLTLFPDDVRIPLPNFQLARTWRPGGFELPRHAHDHTNVALCLAGSYDESVAGRWHRVTHASLICRPAGEAHENRYAYGASRAVIFELPASTLDVISAFSRVLHAPIYLASTEVAQLASRVRAQLRLGDDAARLALEALAYEAISVAARARMTSRGRGPRWLARLREYLHAEFHRSVTVDELASLAGVHPAHLSRTFRAHFGKTIGDYVRDLRLAHAARLLRCSSMSLVEISVASGFYDQSHFTRLFKRRYGVPPAAFRRP